MLRQGLFSTCCSCVAVSVRLELLISVSAINRLVLESGVAEFDVMLLLYSVIAQRSAPFLLHLSGGHSLIFRPSGNEL